VGGFRWFRGAREKRRSSLSTLKSAFSCEVGPDGLDEFHEDMKLLTDRGPSGEQKRLFVLRRIREKRYSFTQPIRVARQARHRLFIVRYVAAL